MNETTKKRGHWIIIVLGVILITLVFSVLLRPIRVGVVLSTDTTIGNEENLAIRYYVRKNTRIGWRPVRLLIRNPSLDANEVAAAYQDLEQKHVSLIIGGAISQTGVILAQEAARSRIPTFGITPASDYISHKDDSFYRIIMSTQIMGTLVANFLHTQGATRVTVLTSVENAAYADPYAQAINEGFNGQTTIIPYHRDPNTLAAVVESDPQVIFNLMPASDLVQIIKFAKETKLSASLMSAPWGAEVLAYFSGSLIDGLKTVSPVGRLSPEGDALTLAFERQYARQSTFASVLAFSLMDILYQALHEVGSRPTSLQQYFRTPRDYPSINGTIHMDAYGDAIQSQYYVYEMHGNETELIHILKVPEGMVP
jgi:ABC-type branched-subunit amino acid transport system substrate-binding protein